MKYLLTLSFLLVGVALYGQTLRTTNQTINNVTITDSLWFTRTEYVNHVFGNLDLQDVTTNFLLQRSLSYFSPLAYDGKNANDSTVHSTAQAMANYSTFYYAALDTAASYAPRHPNMVLDDINGFLQQKQVPISLVNHAYHSIIETALLDGLFTTNVDSTVFYDNPSRIVSPYEKHRMFMSCANLLGPKFISNGDVTFNIIPPVLHFTDTLAGSIEIDFGDGAGYISVTANTLKTVYYSTSGVKLIKVKQGGLESTSEFNFEKNDVFFNETEVSSPEEVMRGPSTSIAIGREFLSCDKTLDKPILIIEGFEILDNQDPSIDKEEMILGNLNSNQLVNRLWNLGYDFIVVKFSNNDASILENADALRTLINDINARKAGTHKLNIIGLSMGGLIAKYCLKDMEDDAVDHQVENFFSYDSPHQGAYVPLGLQYLLKGASRTITAIAQNSLVQYAMGKLGSEAAKEMLLYNMNDPSSTIRSSFASAYAAKGYPTQCTNYGIANGRGDGVGLGYASAAPLMDLYAHAPLGAFRHREELYSLPTGISTITFINTRGIVPFFGAHGLQSYSLRVRYDAELVQETVPGSLIDAHVKYGNPLASKFAQELQYWPYLNYFGRMNTSFVPTVSALDLNNQNYSDNGFYLPRNPFYDIATNRTTVLSSNITPFEDIIHATGGSQGHLDNDLPISNFIFEKIYGSTMPTGCAVICSPTAEFTGLVNVCNAVNPEVTFTNMPSGVSINWVLPSGLQVLSGQGTNKIQINTAAVGTYTGGYVTLSRPGCPSTNYGFTIQFSEPTAIVGPTDLCDNTPYTISNLPIGATVTWEVIGYAAEIIEDHNDYVILGGVDVGQVKLKATIVSDCGTHVLESNYINYGFPYYVTLTDIFNDGMGTSQGYLCSDARENDNYYNTFSYTIQTGAPTVTLHYQIYGSSGLVYSNTASVNGSGTQILPSLPDGNYSLDVWISGGPCDVSTELTEVDIVYQTCDQSKMSVFPNPAKSELKVSFSSDAKHMDISKAKNTQGFSVKLFNEKGKLTKEARTTLNNKNEIVLQVADLPNGTYFLHVFEGKKVTKRQVIVSH